MICLICQTNVVVFQTTLFGFQGLGIQRWLLYFETPCNKQLHFSISRKIEVHLQRRNGQGHFPLQGRLSLHGRTKDDLPKISRKPKNDDSPLGYGPHSSTQQSLGRLLRPSRLPVILFDNRYRNDNHETY